MKSSLIALLVAVNLMMAFADINYENSKVVKLTNANFNELVKNSNDHWFIKFYAPWCGHCKNMAPAWEQAAEKLDGKVKIGAVDMTTDAEAGADYEIQGYPTLKFFHAEGKKNPTEYNGGRSVDALVEWAIEQTTKPPGAAPEKKEEEGSGESDVVILTASNFDELVKNSQDPWFIKFYAPWCGHCKNMAPAWEKAATQLKGQVKIGKVDMTTEGAAGSAYGIKGYPTLKFFGADKENPTDYNGGRSVDALVSWALEQANKPAGEKKEEEAGDSDVVTLTASNFDSLVKNSKDPWFIKFYAPWCGHCKSMAPAWEKAATQLKGKVKIGKVDMTTEGDAGADYDIQGYPTLKFFHSDDKKNPTEYNGGRSVDALVEWALEQAEKPTGTAPEKKEEGPSDVVTLTAANFEELVKNSKDPWFIKFYAPWCGHCKKMAPAWDQLATQLKGRVKIGKVDMTTEGAAGAGYDIQGYPTLKFFSANDKKNPIEYNGGRSVEELSKYALEQAGKGSVGPGTEKPKEAEESTSDVVTLTAANFDELVKNSKDLWFVKFYAPWCGHCKNMAPAWDKAATELKGKVKIGKVDMTTEGAAGSAYGIRGYPTLKFFGADKSTPLDYNGGRSVDELVKYATEQFQKASESGHKHDEI